MLLYTVEPGDTVSAIARLHGVEPAAVIRDNQLADSADLIPGQTLVLPVDFWSVRVAPGQSLYQLATRYGAAMAEIMALNPEITDPARIVAGSVIRIPISPEKRGIDVNGYAYPETAPAVIRETLPYLTYLSIFSYAVNPDGSLRPIDDEPLIALAKAQGVAPLMVITNLAETGGFSSDVASSILRDPALQERLLDEIQGVLERKGYYGLDVDFEYVYEGERELYNAFLQRTADRLRPLGYHLSSAVAPKLSADQQGRLYTAHDYAAHGRILDRVILMTYEWGYLYGPPMAVAPLGPVEQVVRYAVTVIPPEKILLGMPNYGYDWTLPYRQGTAARSITNEEALAIARRYGASIGYDEAAAAPYFNYRDEQGREHVVWFEDARSDLARLRLVEQYGLAGVSYWTVGNFFLPNYLALTSLFTVNKVQGE